MSWDKYLECVDYLYNKLDKRRDQIDVVAGVARGGLIPAVMLSHKLHRPMIVIGDDLVVNRPYDGVLVVDDISDSGTTLKLIERRSKYRELITVTIALKPRTRYLPTYCAFETLDWLVFPWEGMAECDIVPTQNVIEAEVDDAPQKIDATAVVEVDRDVYTQWMEGIRNQLPKDVKMGQDIDAFVSATGLKKVKVKWIARTASGEKYLWEMAKSFQKPQIAETPKLEEKT